jgi:hypothetical protein
MVIQFPSGKPNLVFCVPAALQKTPSIAVTVLVSDLLDEIGIFITPFTKNEKIHFIADGLAGIG